MKATHQDENWGYKFPADSPPQSRISPNHFLYVRTEPINSYTKWKQVKTTFLCSKNTFIFSHKLFFIMTFPLAKSNKSLIQEDRTWYCMVLNPGLWIWFDRANIISLKSCARNLICVYRSSTHERLLWCRREQIRLVPSNLITTYHKSKRRR